MIGAGRSSRIPLLIAAVASGTAGWMGFNHTISAITLDTLASLPASTEEADPRIVIVEIDDASLDALGERWPIARSTWARLLKRLDGFGPRSIGIDAVFAEPSDSSAQRLVAQLRPESSDTLQQQLDGLGDLIAPDEALAEVLGSSDRFVLGTFLSESGVPSPAPVTQTLPRGLGPMASQFDTELASYGAIAESTQWHAALNVPTWGDGVVRDYAYGVGLSDDVVMTLATALYLKSGAVPSDWLPSGGYALLPLVRPESFRTLSMADVLASPVGLGDALRDATLLVGATAEKSYDSLQVYARSMPGVFLHATALDALLKGRRWRSDGPAAGIAAVATFLTLSLVGFLGIRFSLPSLIALSAFALALFVGVGIVSFSRVGWVLPAGPAFFGLGALLAQEGARRYFWARGERLALREKLRREAERAERSRYLESAVAHTADGLVVTDSERQVHFANPAARALLAWGQQDGESFSSDSGGELEVRLPDGGRRWLSVIGSEVTIDDAAQRIYTLRDVTRVRELERLRSQLVATVAHELRSPLAAIRASLRMLEAGVLGPKEGEESVRVAARNTERMVRLIDDTLDAERLEHEQLPIEPVPIESWLRFVQASVEVTRPMAEEKGVTFVFDADDMDSALRGDTDRLTQVLSNLLSNAVKYSESGDTVRIRCWCTGRRVHVAISDEGPGVPEEFRGHLFERFSQAKGAKPGSGLGLFIARKIAIAHSGSLDFKSRGGSGSTFTLSLPRA